MNARREVAVDGEADSMEADGDSTAICSAGNVSHDLLLGR
jgi:hypothetical protein